MSSRHRKNDLNRSMPATRFACIATFILVVFLPAGCSPKSGVIGKWQGTDNQIIGGSMNVIVDFGQDGKETLNYGGANGRILKPIIVSGTYTVGDNTLTQKYTSLLIDGKSMALTPDQTKPKVGTFTLNGDNLILTDTDSHKAITLTRVKE